MKRKILLVDMDDTIASLSPEVIKLFEGISGIKLDIEKMVTPSWQDLLKKHGIDLDTKSICNIINDSDIFRNLPVKEGVKETFISLKEKGIKIVLVTNIPRFDNKTVGLILESKLEWFRFHFNEIIDPFDFIMTKRKELVRGDVLIDDYPGNIIRFPGRSIIFDQPWNRHILNIPRISSWPEILNFF